MAFKNKDRSEPGTGGRLETLDLLRGATLISMIFYHGMWDFIYLSETGGRMSALKDWYRGPGGFSWQQSICWTFILLSGFCVPFSRHIFRRGLQVSAAGLAVSAVTLLWMYDERVVWGVLSFLGAAMLLSGAGRFLKGGSRDGSRQGLSENEQGRESDRALKGGGRDGSRQGLSESEQGRKSDRALKEDSPGCSAPQMPSEPGAGSSSRRGKALAGFVLCCLLFYVFRWVNIGYLQILPGRSIVLPESLYREGISGAVLTVVGFPMKDFFSTDYFSLLPWIFLFRAGFYLHGIMKERGWFVHPAFRLRLPVLNWMGKHSLLIYLLHQPVLYLLTVLLF